MLNLKKDSESVTALKDLISSTLDSIALVDKDYRYVLANEIYLKLNNKSLEEIVGTSMADLVGEEVFTETIKPRLDHCLEDNIINHQEWVDNPGAGRCFMDLSYVPHHDAQGKVRGVLVTGRDITELADSMEALNDAEKRVQLMSEAGNIGHAENMCDASQG